MTQGTKVLTIVGTLAALGALVALVWVNMKPKAPLPIKNAEKKVEADAPAAKKGSAAPAGVGEPDASGPVVTSKPLSAGMPKCNEVARLQDDLGNLGQGITVDGDWGTGTTTAINAQYAAWNLPAPSSVTLDDFEALISKNGGYGGQPAAGSSMTDSVSNFFKDQFGV